MLRMLVTNFTVKWMSIFLVQLIPAFLLAGPTDLTETFSPKQHKWLNEFIQKYPDSYEAFVALQRMVEHDIQRHDWEHAEEVLLTYRPMFLNHPPPHDTTAIDSMIAILHRPWRDLIIQRLPSYINSLADEYLPRLNMNGTVLYFTGDNRSGGLGGEDIFATHFDTHEGKWLQPICLPEPVNTESGNEGALAISPDGRTLLVYGTYSDKDSRGNLYTIQKTPSGWANPVSLSDEINSEDFDAGGFFTYDGKALIFTSSRHGNIGSYHPKGMEFHGDRHGNQDIYVSVLDQGAWSKPVNLGSTINTPFAEVSPFLHPDGLTLYFSSDGHPGLGRLDVFKAKRKSRSTWTEWEKPVNLGKEINSSANNFGYFLSPDGEIAYYTDESEKFFGRRHADIFVRTIPPEAKPDPVTHIEGEVLDLDGNPLPDVEVSVKDMDDGEELARTRTDKNGKFEVLAPDQESPVVIEVEDDNFFPTASDPINIMENSDKTGESPLTPQKDEHLSTQPSDRDGGSDSPQHPDEELKHFKDLKDYQAEEIQEDTRSDVDRVVEAFEDSIKAKLETIPPPEHFLWPLVSPDSSFSGAWAISAHVDHNPNFPNALRDYQCGERTYDLEVGYNHRGTDIFPWPFPWYQMDNDLQHVVAVSAGIIVGKDDGFPDRNCGLDSDQAWNAIYVFHADSSIAWYGHLKAGSLTTKNIGDPVDQGEFLGVVGSSGASTGPHLHFELYDRNRNLIDPFRGKCDTGIAGLDWLDHKPYWDANINLILTHGSHPLSVPCPGSEVLNIQTEFTGGDSLMVGSYYREFETGLIAEYELINPSGTIYTTWKDTSIQSSPASISAWWFYLPLDVQTGIWTVNGSLGKRNHIHQFRVNETPEIVSEKPFADHGTARKVKLDKPIQTFPEKLLSEELAEPICTNENNIYFDFNSRVPSQSSMATLERIAEQLSQFEERELEITGHTDSKGSYEYNKKLSKSRASSVRAYLAQNGLDENNISVKALGEEDLEVDSTGEVPWMSRRVEICILK